MASQSRQEWLKTREVPHPPLDTTPVEVPVEFQKPPTIKEELQRYVRYEVSRIGQDEGFASFEEEDDFELEDGDDDTDLLSEHQVLELAPEEGESESLDGAPAQEAEQASQAKGPQAEAEAAPVSAEAASNT